MNKYSLNGEWILCWQETGIGRIEHVDRVFEREQVVVCKVPGDIHMALTDVGIIKEPLVDRNSEECRWLEEKEFWYKKVFYIDETFLQDTTELVFEGLDLTADIWLNGQYIGNHNNAFIEKVIDVSAFIKVGDNELVVRIDDGVHAVKDKSIEQMKYSWNSEQPYRAWMRKPQFVYGWDWTIWLPTCGIWKDVYINTYQKAAIKDWYIETKYESEEISKADKVVLVVAADVDIWKPGKYVLKCQVLGDVRYESSEEIVAKISKEICVDEKTMLYQSLELLVEKPKLWWP